jgi:hypothetical protein
VGVEDVQAAIVTIINKRPQIIIDDFFDVNSFSPNF